MRAAEPHNCPPSPSPFRSANALGGLPTHVPQPHLPNTHAPRLALSGSVSGPRGGAGRSAGRLRPGMLVRHSPSFRARCHGACPLVPRPQTQGTGACRCLQVLGRREEGALLHTHILFIITCNIRLGNTAVNAQHRHLLQQAHIAVTCPREAGQHARLGR